MQKKQRSQVISLRISNIDLAGCLEFEELLSSSPSSKLSSSISLLITSTLKLLKENKKITEFNNFSAEEKIRAFLLSTGRTVIGKKELISLSSSFLALEEKRNEEGKIAKKAFSPANFSSPPRACDVDKGNSDVLAGKENSDVSTGEEERKEETETLPIVCLERRKNEREILESYEKEIEKEVEEIIAEEELTLLQKIFMPISPLKKGDF